MHPDFRVLASPIIRAGNPGTQTFNRAYHAHFGVSAEVSLQLWLLLVDAELLDNLLPKHLLWALFFLKKYPTEHVGASRWNVTPKTFRKYIWKMIHTISQLGLVCIIK